MRNANAMVWIWNEYICFILLQHGIEVFFSSSISILLIVSRHFLIVQQSLFQYSITVSHIIPSDIQSQAQSQAKPPTTAQSSITTNNCQSRPYNVFHQRHHLHNPLLRPRRLQQGRLIDRRRNEQPRPRRLQPRTRRR